MTEQGRSTSAGVESLVERVRTLQDEDRVALAEARAALDETFHAGAWKAANEVVAERARDYMEPLVRMGSGFVPQRLEELVRMGAEADPLEVMRWQGVARLARAAMEDALLALVAADRLRPPDLRELYGPWRAMLDAAYERTDGTTTA